MLFHFFVGVTLIREPFKKSLPLYNITPILSYFLCHFSFHYVFSQLLDFFLNKNLGRRPMKIYMHNCTFQWAHISVLGRDLKFTSINSLIKPIPFQATFSLFGPSTWPGPWGGFESRPSSSNWKSSVYGKEYFCFYEK